MTKEELQDQPGDTGAVLAAKAAMRRAIDGHIHALAELANRAEGTPIQTSRGNKSIRGERPILSRSIWLPWADLSVSKL